MTTAQLDETITKEKAHIDRLEEEKKRIRIKINRLELMEQEFYQITGTVAPVEFDFQIRKLKEDFNQCCDIIEMCQQEIKACVSQKRKNTKSEKISEAYQAGIKAYEESLKSGQWEATCPYQEKYLQKAFKEGAFKEGWWTVKFA